MNGLIMTWPKIAEFCGFSESKAKRLRGKMMEKGVVFRRRRKCGAYLYCAWPEDLRGFIKGEA